MDQLKNGPRSLLVSGTDIMTVAMQGLEEPLSQEEIKELHKLLESESLLEKMVERRQGHQEL